MDTKFQGKALRVMGMFAFMAAAALAPALAEADDASSPAQEEKACAAAVKSCSIKNVGDAYGDMRAACKAFRSCKNDCKSAKTACAKAAKADKKDCTKTCKSKTGKAKKACLQSCRQEKKATKKECRQAKKSCKNTCGKELKSKDCVKARAGFWGNLAEAAKNCTADVAKACKDVFPKK